MEKKKLTSKVFKKLNRALYIPKYFYNRLVKRNVTKLPEYKASKPPRVAFCLYGIVGGKKGKDNAVGSKDILNIGYHHYKKHIFDKNLNIDVFIHTWSTDLKKEIIELYQPKKSIFQKQISFNIPDYVAGETRRKQNHYSRWYSTKKVIELKSQYEKENNFKYDVVMITRFDLAFEEDFIFDKFDPSYFYAAKGYSSWNLFGFIPIYLPMSYPYLDHFGLADLWFFSNSENMDKFSKLFDNLDEYNHPENCERTGQYVSPHILSRYHLQKIGLANKLKLVFNRFGWWQSKANCHFLFRWYVPKESAPAIRRKYFGCKY